MRGDRLVATRTSKGEGRRPIGTSHFSLRDLRPWQPGPVSMLAAGGPSGVLYASPLFSSCLYVGDFCLCLRVVDFSLSLLHVAFFRYSWLSWLLSFRVFPRRVYSRIRAA